MGKSTISSFSKTSFTTGESVTITIASQNSSYTHKLAHSFGDIATLSAGTKTYKWTPTANSLASFFKEVPNLKTRPIDIYLYTYNGSTLVGRDARTLTVTLKESDGRPTAEIMYDMAPDDLLVLTDHRDMFGGLVSGIDTLSLYANPATYYGASVRQIVGEWCGQTVYPDSNGFLGFTAMTSNQNTTDHSPIYITVTDSRGYSSKYNVSIGSYDEPPIVFLNGNNTTPIVSYSAPKITSIDVDRCTSDKVISNDGTNLMVTLGMNVTSLNENNQFAIGMWYKKSTDSSWTTFSQSWYLIGELDEDGYTLYYGSQKNRLFCPATFEIGTSYDIKIRISDSFKYVEETVILSAAGTMMEFSADGKKVIFGETSGPHLLLDDNSLDIRKGIKSICGFSYEFYDEKSSPQLKIGNSEIADVPEATGELFGSGTDNSEAYDSILYITNPYSIYIGRGGFRSTIQCDYTGVNTYGDITFHKAVSGKDDGKAIFYIPPTFRAGYNIPLAKLVGSANFNDMTQSGIYWMDYDATNGPSLIASGNCHGWLEVKSEVYDSDTFITQTFTHYGGSHKFRRSNVYGNWGSWVLDGGYNLYNNTSGTTGTIKLSKSAANFQYITVYYKTASTNNYSSTTIWSPNGKTISLHAGYGNSNYSYFYHTGYAISDTSMTVSSYNYGLVSLKSSSYPSRTRNNNIYILKVVGHDN